MNKIPNILHLSVRADYGGGPRHIDEIIKNTNYSVYLACPPDKPYYKTWKALKNVKDVCLIPHRGLTLDAVISLVLFCKKHKISIIHSHGKGAGIYSRILKLLLPHIKVVHTYHGIPSEDFNSIKRKFSNTVEKLLAPLTYKFINVSFSEQKECQRAGILSQNKTSVVYNGITPLKLQKESKNPLSLDKKFVIASLSRFDYQKNMKETIRIAEKLKEYSEIVFLLIGDGEDKKPLEREAKERGLKNIIFTGFRTDIDYLLSQANLYLSSARWEGLPIALIEATSLSIPIVASDVVGNNEVVENGKTGYLYPLGDVNLACETILKLYNNKQLHATMATAALHRYQTYFTSNKMIESLENIYQNI